MLYSGRTSIQRACDKRSMDERNELIALAIVHFSFIHEFARAIDSFLSGQRCWNAGAFKDRYTVSTFGYSGQTRRTWMSI
jgi:hypothetical protein